MDFFDALLRYEIDLWNHLDRHLLESGGPSLAVLEALRVLARHKGKARVVELQNEMRITVGAASKWADRLERDGLGTRRANPDDRRSSMLTLTAEGERKHAAGLAVMAAFLDDHIAGFTQETESGARLLRSLTGRLETGAN
jgi:DNA-binding MarR family transcriptional regulator